MWHIFLKKLYAANWRFKTEIYCANEPYTAIELWVAIVSMLLNFSELGNLLTLAYFFICKHDFSACGKLRKSLISLIQTHFKATVIIFLHLLWLSTSSIYSNSDT